MAEIITIHQPEHLPWLGFFAKAACADLVVLLDSVSFRKNHFQNRNRVLGFDGQPLWLTVPVNLDNHLDGTIRDICIAEDRRWRKKYLRTLEQRYRKHQNFHQVYAPLAEILERPWTHLVDLNQAIIDVLQPLLQIPTPRISATEVGGTGTRNSLLLDLCKKLDARVYISGPTGREYLDLERFRREKIEVWFHDYDHPTYAQYGSASFVSHLSTVDLLFNAGDDSGEILRRGSIISRM